MAGVAEYEGPGTDADANTELTDELKGMSVTELRDLAGQHSIPVEDGDSPTSWTSSSPPACSRHHPQHAVAGAAGGRVRENPPRQVARRTVRSPAGGAAKPLSSVPAQVTTGAPPGGSGWQAARAAYAVTDSDPQASAVAESRRARKLVTGMSVLPRLRTGS